MQTNLLQFAHQKYLQLETFRQNGQGVKTPVWFVQADEIFYTRTVRTSGKVKRIQRQPQVNIMPCGQMGEPLGEWLPAQAQEVTDPAIFNFVRHLLVEKYGDLVAMFEAQTQAKGLEYTVLVIKPGDPA